MLDPTLKCPRCGHTWPARAKDHLGGADATQHCAACYVKYRKLAARPPWRPHKDYPTALHRIALEECYKAGAVGRRVRGSGQ